MKIHEYQGKDILRSYGVPVTAGRGGLYAGRGSAAAVALGGGTVVVKAQIHAGGRGKGGGVKVVKNPDEAHDSREGDPRHDSSSPIRPGPEGRTVGRVLVEEGPDDRARAVSRHGHRSLDASGRC